MVTSISKVEVLIDWWSFLAHAPEGRCVLVPTLPKVVLDGRRWRRVALLPGPSGQDGNFLALRAKMATSKFGAPGPKETICLPNASLSSVFSYFSETNGKNPGKERD